MSDKKTLIDQETQEWRRQVLEEATRIRSALKDVQQRRKEAKEEAENELGPTPRNHDIASEMEKLEAAQASLTRNNTRLARLTSGLIDAKSTEDAVALQEKAAEAQLEQLKMAQAEMEKTNARLRELNEEVDDEEIAAEDAKEEAEAQAEASATKKVPPIPKLHKTQSMMDADESKWEDLKQQESTRITPRSLAIDTQGMTPRSAEKFRKQKKEFEVPADGEALGTEPSFDIIKREMQLTSSPLVFFNLACFQGSRNADMDVMHPICGYAVAGRLLAIMGPQGTDTSTLRDALSDHHDSSPQSSVIVADFTIQALIEVADAILRPDTMRPSENLVEHFQLSAVANVKVGTCIHRNQPDGSTMGTPRGSRNPEAPTPRNPNTPRLAGSRAAIQKSVLLMDDLLEVLDAESVFRLLRVLRKIAINRRASVIVTVGADFGRRGLLQLFDDVLYFTQDGVSFFGPSHRMGDFCSLIGSPMPEKTHPTDHIKSVSNIAAKYDECPIKKIVDAVILEYTGTSEKVDSTDSTSDANVKSRKKSAFVPRFMRKKKEKRQVDVPDELESANKNKKMSARARRLALKLAEERRAQALMEKAEQKLAVWNKMADLDRHIARGQGLGESNTFNSFELMLAHFEKDTKRQRPSCFMNLACFLSAEEEVPEVIAKPTCAYANEGRVLGVLGPPSADPENLLNSLKLSSNDSAFTTVTDMTVKGILKLSEFIKNRDKDDPESGLDDNVSNIMAKMMLTASSNFLIGTLIQRATGPVAANTQVQIGDQIMSTAVRSILILDKILDLDAQSLFVVLKLIKRIAAQARLAVVFMLKKPEEAQGLFSLIDNLLAFNEEGVAYFGPAAHLPSYFSLIDLPVPKDKHVSLHLIDAMQTKTIASYTSGLDTPLIVRYQMSPLFTFNRSVFEITAAPADQGGQRTSRMMVPKSFRKKSIKATAAEIAREQAELKRQKEYQVKMVRKEEDERKSAQHSAFEEMWKKLIISEKGGAKPNVSEPVSAGFESIIEKMSDTEKPSLFFNLACFLPTNITDRIDILQPICGYSLVGNIVAIMGPPSTDSQIFINVLCAAQPSSQPMGPPAAPKDQPTSKSITLLDLMEIAESTRPDRGSKPLNDSARMLMKNLGLAQYASVKIGTIIQRPTSQNSGKKLASILVLSNMTQGLDPQSIFVVIKLVKRIAPQAMLAVVLYLESRLERHGLFPLVDDVLVFDKTGVSYFGPASSLKSYLTLVGLPVPETSHPVDHLVAASASYGENRMRNSTDTSPSIRYKYSPVAEHVSKITSKFTRPASDNEFNLESYRSGSETSRSRRPSITFIPKGTQRKRRGSTAEQQSKIDFEEAKLAQEKVAEKEAEAERMRQYETEAEAVWKKLMSS